MSRFLLTERTPAILQFPNGLRAAGELHVISRTGGLLLLPAPVLRGSVVELTFETHRGPVLGTAEMLTPITHTQQPFRFLALPENGHRTLQVAFQSGLYRNIDEQERIEELRAAVARWTPPPPRRRFIIRLALLIGLGGVAASILGGHYLKLFAHFVH